MFLFLGLNFTMISLVYIIITCLCWLLLLTIGLPLTLILLFSKSFRGLLFAWLYSRIEPFFKTITDFPRKKAFQILNDSLTDQSGPLEVLEIGVGHGPNLPFFPKNCFLTVLDKNKAFEPYFLKNLKENPHVSYRRLVIHTAEKMLDIDDESFDVVISSYLHCSTDDSNAVLEEVKRVLKPGGKYLFLEHVGFPEGDIGLYIQKFISPLWVLFSNGCIMHRDIARTIKSAGFSDFKYEKFIVKPFIMYVLSNQIAGIATK